MGSPPVTPTVTAIPKKTPASITDIKLDFISFLQFVESLGCD